MTAFVPSVIDQRTFLPRDLDAGEWSQVEPWYRALLERRIQSAADLERWLADFSELHAVVSEFAALKQIAHACHTDDPEIEQAYLHYVENIAPKVKPLFFELQRRFVECPHLSELDGGRYEVLEREWRADVELFRQENVPLQTKITKLNTKYDKLIGAMIVEFRGEQLTLQQLARFLEEPDRPTREAAWRLATQRRLEDRAAIEDLFDQMLRLREQMAVNADLADYLEYAWKAKGRFDYTPDDCLAFADAIETSCVPLVEELDAQRAADLGVERLRPWDVSVDPKGRPPLRPFDADQPEQLVEKVRAIFDRLSPPLAEDFATLRFGSNLDLDSRKGKRAGGFQSSLMERREPFIFMNAAGLHRDVETLLHEGGHAFHFIWASNHQKLSFQVHAPLEFCEVASMSMELAGADHFDQFYPEPANAVRARRDHLEGVIRMLPWIATIDSFQHWIYTHHGHTPDQRRDAWLVLRDRFKSRHVDYSGHEAAHEAMWHRQLHLFHHPFYYIEYGIAQLGALQLWLQFRRDRTRALANYRRALELGGTRPLPELFEAAGLRFDFSSQTLEPLMEAVSAELDSLAG